MTTEGKPVEGQPDEPLVPVASHTAYTLFLGVTQHQLYHAGQIASLKRALVAADDTGSPARA